MIQLTTGEIMFVVGLGIGPVLGLLFGDAVFRSRSVNSRIAFAALVIVGAIFLFIPAINTELKLGLLAGVPLGILLTVTPVAVDNHNGETPI